MRTMKLAALLLISISAFGCKKDAAKSDKTAGSGAPTPVAKSTEPKVDGPAFMAAWDMPARTAAWQGAWAGDGQSLGDTAAWEIKGDDVTMVNKKGEQKFKLTVDSPCTATFKQDDGHGGSSSFIAAYTLKDGQLITGLGDAGSKKGDQAVVCGGGEIWVFDGKTCTDWSNNFGRWESKPGDCGFKKDDKGVDVFFYKGMGGYESKDLVEGDVIWTEQLKNTHATKQADLAAAKTAQKL